MLNIITDFFIVSEILLLQIWKCGTLSVTYLKMSTVMKISARSHKNYCSRECGPLKWRRSTTTWSTWPKLPSPRRRIAHTNVSVPTHAELFLSSVKWPGNVKSMTVKFTVQSFPEDFAERINYQLVLREHLSDQCRVIQGWI